MRDQRPGKPKPYGAGSRPGSHALVKTDEARTDRRSERPERARAGFQAAGKHQPRFRSEKPRTQRPDGGYQATSEGRPSRPKSAPGYRPETADRRQRDGKPKRHSAPVPAGGAPLGPMRIAKAMARAGMCSRREAERWIWEGRVSVNGKVLGSPAFEVGPRDKIVIDGEPLPEAEPVRLWRYYKPRGLVTTHKDPEERPTVFDNLPPGLPRVISIGRLDYNTEGLLLLTTDGALARYLELPQTGWLRRYRVRARGRITQAQLTALKDGVTIEGIHYGPIEATLDSEKGANTWLTVGLREGKNREIRKIMGHLNLEVGRLIRVSFGPFQLNELEPGEADPVKRRVLAEQLGHRLARELGVIAGTEPGELPMRAPRLRHRKPDAASSTAGATASGYAGPVIDPADPDDD